MRDSLIVNQVRGMHSTGLFQVGNDGAISYFKSAVNASAFISLKEAKDILGKAARTKLTVGHVRHATQGASDLADNAHPFLVTRQDGSQLIGVHNGTFRNWKNKKNSKDVDVDSAWAFQMLAEENADAFEYFDGAFALVWYDSRTPDVIYMARNKERPLHFVVSEDRKSMFGMSELGSLGWLAGKHDVKRHKDGYLYLDPGHIYTFSLKDIGQFTKAEYPAYDHNTTIYTPAVYHGQASRMYDEADWGGGGFGFHGDRVPFRAQGYRAPEVDYNFERTDRILGQVKLALQKARRARDAENSEETEETTVIDQEKLDRELEEGISKEIQQFHAAQARSTALVPVSSLRAPMFLVNPSDKTASRKEIAAVQDHALYGMVVDFTGILYDDVEDVVYGEAQVLLSGKWTTRETILRGLGSRKAKFAYGPNKGPRRVVLCGIMDRKDSNLPPALIAAELSNDQRQLILEEVHKRVAH